LLCALTRRAPPIFCVDEGGFATLINTKKDVRWCSKRSASALSTIEHGFQKFGIWHAFFMNWSAFPFLFCAMIESIAHLISSISLVKEDTAGRDIDASVRGSK
ncbi:MAG: hypothetical protein ACJ788_04255, partial [Ktedonobacteraceae bacterium]